MTAPNERLSFNWFLSGTDNQDHAVVDEESARALHTGSGLCEALCGHLVVPRSLTVPPGPRCARCLLFVRARATLSDPDLRMAARPRRRHRAPTFLRGLFRRPVRSAACTAVPRADRTAPDRGGPAAETPPSGGAAAYHRRSTPQQMPSTAEGRPKHGTEHQHGDPDLRRSPIRLR